MAANTPDKYSGYLPGKLVQEILKWLPAKSLMRFKPNVLRISTPFPILTEAVNPPLSNSNGGGDNNKIEVGVVENPIEMTIELPRELGDGNFRVLGILPDGKQLMHFSEFSAPRGGDLVRVHLYDPCTREREEILINLVRYTKSHMPFLKSDDLLVSCYEENLISLKCLIS
ncbi:OLC1v1036861C1 [Oldenlandia corymbosa var. corymbosa]|uniref:OLC1v1036861C1 n=1 Tax=Oldenlandia corymbosa var. corymbosa TaxID=529605 RepID=A0AAV1CZJ2_OLDCO|nr:OLC1v1036861C1 [Oldenlandia corymbosa var. corymbosa]